MPDTCVTVSLLQVFRDEGLVYMVLEYGDIDLARLLHNHEEARRKGYGSEGEIDANFIRLYWQQMLQVRPCIIPGMSRCDSDEALQAQRQQQHVASRTVWRRHLAVLLQVSSRMSLLEASQ